MKALVYVCLIGILKACEMADSLEIPLYSFEEETFLLEQNLDPVVQKTLLETPNPERCRENLRFYASREHMAGTQGDFELAIWTRDRMRDMGFYSTVHEMPVKLNYPKSHELYVTNKGKELFRASLEEDILDSDPSSDSEFRNKSFLAYVPSGEALEKKLVYANYGRPEDFEYLETENISVRNKIVIVRYGQCFRGLKIMNAEKAGAVGVIIFSDPGDDGYGAGEVYPKGKWRPESSVQRGSAQFNSLCIGDPFRGNIEETCGYSSAELVPRIPAIPISYGDAIPLLELLGKNKGSKLAPKNWRGGLQETLYHLGPSLEDVNLKVETEFKTVKIWNVISMLKGEYFGTQFDQPVILGNHRDAWIFGAADPNSGSALMLEVAESISAAFVPQNLFKFSSGENTGGAKGLKRSLLFGSWSGEEYGLLGSTGWTEYVLGKYTSDSILKNMLLASSTYINVDIGVSGEYFVGGASGSLGDVLKQTVDLVDEYKASTSGKPISWDRKILTLGSGSDYAVFLDNLGIASFDLRFSTDAKDKRYGTYHSVYDSYTYIETVVDPDFSYHADLARIVSVLAIKLATNPLLPINLVQEVIVLQTYIKELQNSAGFSSFLEEISGLREESGKLLETAKKFQNLFIHGCNAREFDCNYVAAQFEREFLGPGLPKRKHFKSVLQAPGLYLGYAAETLPGVQQSLQFRDEDLFHEQCDVVKKAMKSAQNLLNRVF
eukprot:snap_masked-scaffold_30-processed-gene-0.17-mRNA-1 protein AED:0.01 eAED:0.01 QI:0/-1/0/1/-1/1/1/0/720